MHDDPVKEKALRDKVERAVRTEYTLGREDLRISDLFLIRQPRDEILARSRTRMEYWLRQIRAARRAGAAIARNHMAQQRIAMRNWLRQTNIP